MIGAAEAKPGAAEAKPGAAEAKPGAAEAKPGAAGAKPHDVRVWVAAAPVDMRKSFDTLAEVVRAFLGHDPHCGHLFVFRNRSAERIKILWWDKNGLAIYYKRLERGTFPFPASATSAQKSIAITAAQLARLIEGCAIEARPQD